MPRTGENIYKRKDGRWEGRYIRERVDGKARYGAVYARSYREVKKKLEKAKEFSQRSWEIRSVSNLFRPYFCFISDIAWAAFSE